jgi:hypothetical protein
MTERCHQMGRRVLKYLLIDAVHGREWPFDTDYVIEMPARARIVKVDHQDGIVTIWAEVGRGSDDHVRRLFRIYGTGQPIVDDDVYVGTYFEGPYVWHVYEHSP